MKFSVGICAYNEEKNIGFLIENLLRHQTKHPLEKIIIVASGCSDETVPIVREKAKKTSKILFFEEKKRKGKFSAINKIFTNNKSPILVMTDADCLLQDGAIDKLLERFTNGHCGAVVGRTVPINKRDDGFWGYISHFRYELFHYGAIVRSEKGDYCHLSGYLYAIRKELAKEIPKVICDDLFVGVNVKKQGYCVYYEPEAVVNIRHPSNLRDFYHQRSNIRLGHLQIESLTGHRPSSTIAFQVFPLVLIVLESMKVKKREVFYTFLVAFIEQFIAIHAYFKMKQGRVSPLWKHTPSSKKLMND